MKQVNFPVPGEMSGYAAGYSRFQFVNRHGVSCIECTGEGHAERSTSNHHDATSWPMFLSELLLIQIS
jgi:hypothetical protein